MTQPDGTRWTSNVRWGVKWALGFALMYSILAIIISAVTGGHAVHRMNTTVGKVVAWYFCAAIVVGLTIGLLRPLAKRGRMAAALVGTLAALPATWLATVGLFGDAPGSSRSILTTVISAVLLGGGFGYQSWEEDART